MTKNLLPKSRRLPPLNAVRAFEAAGRRGGIQAAAAELNVTPTAISQQVRLLEDWLERPLFERHSRGVTLTPLGASLWPEFEAILDRLDAVGRQARSRPAVRALSIATLHSFAVCWLMPRLPQLREALGGIEIRLVTAVEIQPFEPGGPDISIRFCAGVPSGVIAELLCSGALTALASPALLAKGPPIRTPDDLRHYPLIHEEHHMVAGMPELVWAEWLRLVGASGVQVNNGAAFTFAHLCLQAAEAGYGVALGSAGLAADAVAAGRLVQVLPQSVEQAGAYRLVYPQERADDPLIRRFRDWIMAEMPRSLAAARAAADKAR